MIPFQPRQVSEPIEKEEFKMNIIKMLALKKKLKIITPLCTTLFRKIEFIEPQLINKVPIMAKQLLEFFKDVFSYESPNQ